MPLCRPLLAAAVLAVVVVGCAGGGSDAWTEADEQRHAECNELLRPVGELTQKRNRAMDTGNEALGLAARADGTSDAYHDAMQVAADSYNLALRYHDERRWAISEHLARCWPDDSDISSTEMREQAEAQRDAIVEICRVERLYVYGARC